jgi:hypothetical protein
MTPIYDKAIEYFLVNSYITLFDVYSRTLQKLKVHYLKPLHRRAMARL